MKSNFYSHGKLLLSGEYFILDGAEGLAIPCRYGQDLQIEETNSQWFIWKSYTRKNKMWFWMQCSMEWLFDPTLIPETNHQEIAQNLLQLLRTAKQNNPAFLENAKGVLAQTHLEFPRAWGLGSSSTLLNNLAQWAQINPYLFLKDRFKGSGYDIACAQHDRPIIFQKIAGDPFVNEVSFNPPFADQLYFVFTDKKQHSHLEIAHYQQQTIAKKEAIKKLDALTQLLLSTNDFKLFCEVIDQHEELVATLLQKTKIKELLFPDFNGSVKSLGAWGGDFVLVCGDKKTPSYLAEKGFKTVIPFRDMIYSTSKN